MVMARWMRWVSLLVGITLLSGCARYEYELVKPADQAGHIGSSVQEVKLEPVSYRMQSYENHLVVQVYNISQEPVMLLGEQSSIVTPAMQSIPIQGQTIAPGAFMKLVLPPLRTNIQPSGPAIHIGFGMQVRNDASGKESAGRSVADEVQRRVVYLVDLEDGTSWDWDGQTNVTLILAYRQGEKTFSHELVFHRVKM